MPHMHAASGMISVRGEKTASGRSRSYTVEDDLRARGEDLMPMRRLMIGWG